MLSRMLSTGVAMAFVACGSNVNDQGSDVSQLTQIDYKCVEYTDAQIAANLQGMPAGFMAAQSWRSADLERARNALAGLPAGYLEYLYGMHEFNGFTISQRNLGQGVGGRDDVYQRAAAH
jgi:hypothetical protein